MQSTTITLPKVDLDNNDWQVEELTKAIQEADRPDAQFVEHDKVSKWLKSWGTEKELEPPECE